MKVKMHSLFYVYNNNTLGIILTLLHLAKIIMDILYLTKEHWYITPHTELPVFIKETLADLKPLINKRVPVGVFNTHFHQQRSHPEKKNQSEKCWS